MEGYLEVVLVVLALSAVFTFLSSIFLIRIEKKLGILCKDAHKPYEYYVPCIGGFPLFLGTLLGLIILAFLDFLDVKLVISSVTVMICGLMIGFLDDIYDLKSRWKIILGFIPAIPLVLMGCYKPKPWIPFIGSISLRTLYPLLLLVASTVYLNGANMIDTHNGLLPMYALMVIFFAFLLKISTVFTIEEVVLATLFIVTLLIYLLFNMYPAKLFNGNTGAYLIGSILLLTIVVLRVEFYAITASIPMFLNGFYYITSIKGFLQKEQVDRPTIVDKHGCIHPSRKLYPITFVKLTLLIGGKSFSEKELIKVMYIIYATTSLLGYVICYTLGYS
jgi:UDP-N-acetylglucosamine--dolichyl-phosphate N-acetylglucosaminephosphotransferase